MGYPKEISDAINFLYRKLNFKIDNFQSNKEGKEYNACSYNLGELKIISRKAKITPKKIGYFVAVWKRNSEGITEPFDFEDDFSFFVINIENQYQKGQFIFSKEVLKKHGIISNNGVGGKRGFRLYAPWDNPTSKQGLKTQTWQLNYFLSLDYDKGIDIERANFLYKS